jgi:hypothetical protein
MTQSEGIAKSIGPQTRNPDGWPYADAYDEVTAAGQCHLVRYEDDHIRLVEVAYTPGIETEMHGSPYPSVIASDAPEPTTKVTWLEPTGSLHGEGAGHAPPPLGLDYPLGTTMAPVAPRSIANTDSFPLHFYKIEFKRIDGEEFQTKWKEWYPWMLDPFEVHPNIDPRDSKLGSPISEMYPFGAATESYIAAPNNHYVRFEDDHVVLLEVAFRPNERENLHGHQDASVFARDIGLAPRVSGRTPLPDSLVQPPTNIPGFNDGGVSGDWKLIPEGINGQGGGSGAPPAGMSQPSCATMGPQWPHAAACSTDWPVHFYRLQFKRIDGEGIRTHWREWYPWMDRLEG